MNPQQLRTFLAVVGHRSFSAAGTALGYTQSAVSQQIAQLEADLGAPLLLRRPVTPTPAGERLLTHAPALLLRLDAARADIARLRTPAAEPLVLACTPLSVTPPVVSALPATVELHIVKRGTINPEGTLVDGIVAPSDPLPPVDQGLLVSHTVAEQPLVVLLPPDHPLASRSSLRLADLSEAAWLNAPDCAIPLPRLREVSRTPGFRPTTTIHGPDLHAAATLTAHGRGLLLAPTSLTGLAGTTAVPLTQPRLLHRTVLLTPQAPSPATATLTTHLTARTGGGG